MVIEDNRLTDITDLCAGEVFEYEGNIYIRTDSNDFAAVQLSTGALCSLDMRFTVRVLTPAILTIQ